MFNRRLAAFFFTWICFTLATGWFLHFSTNADSQLYQQLLDQSDSSSLKDKKTGLSFQQSRQGIAKQVLYTQGKERLQWNLSSPFSELNYAERQGRMDLIEYFKGFLCTIEQPIEGAQEKKAFQRIQAKEGAYYHKDGKLLAHQAHFARYFQPTKSNPPLPFMHGSAKQIEISFSKCAPSMKMGGWRATIAEKSL